MGPHSSHHLLGASAKFQGGGRGALGLTASEDGDPASWRSSDPTLFQAPPLCKPFHGRRR